jgi:hypothetical protein
MRGLAFPETIEVLPWTDASSAISVDERLKTEANS